MRQQDVHDELRARLHEAAGEHEPDRAYMLARIERGMAAQDRPGHRAVLPPVWGWLRVAGATAAVAGMLAAGGYAVASAVKDDDRVEQTVAVSPTPEDSPGATSRPPATPQATPSSGSADGAASATPRRPSGSASAPSSPSASAPSVVLLPGTDDDDDGPLWSDGSVDPHSNEFWAQSNVTIRAKQPATKLTVQLRIAQTGGVTDAGSWRSLPEDDFDLTVTEQGGYLVYTWVLKAGRTVPVGEWVFAGQYDHDRGGRDANGDSYVVTGRSDDRDRVLGGDFAVHDDDVDASSTGDS
ncbi:hypothetical protein ACIPSE_19755 [Streptomyces sp. NPDC090106]|uniref:hypothetical protein n=1 Tax=Streptomyces sp. NPDC090106 TaxID=3365946 RepID=UPI003809F0AF